MGPRINGGSSASSSATSAASTANPAEGADLGIGNEATGRVASSVWRIESRTRSWMKLPCRKRTSVFEGWTFTSTSLGGISRKIKRHGENPRRQDVSVGFRNGMENQAVAHQAPVHKEVNVVAIQLLDFRP